MKFVVDSLIPFINGRLEPFGNVVYSMPEDITPQLVADADAVFVRTRTRCNEALLKDSNVKFVATATIGLDHIDREWCEQNGITAVNAPGCNAPGVAQYVWTTLLGMGFDTSIHTLGIVGYGNVGKIVAEWGRAMGVNVLVNDPPLKGKDNFESTPLNELLKQCDAVSLHVPLNRKGKYATYHMIGEKELRDMRHGSIIINASRGGVVDESALIPHLKEKRLRAAIDTWEGEPKVNHTVLELAEEATTHIAGYSLKGKQRATRMVLEAAAQKFGITPDLSDLEGPYTGLPDSLTAEQVKTAILNTDKRPLFPDRTVFMTPKDFEIARETYPLATEPDFNI